jgi:hypothetical protein
VLKWIGGKMLLTAKEQVLHIVLRIMFVFVEDKAGYR